MSQLTLIVSDLEDKKTKRRELMDKQTKILYQLLTLDREISELARSKNILEYAKKGIKI